MGFARAAGTLLMMGRWGDEEEVDEAEAEGGRRWAAWRVEGGGLGLVVVFVAVAAAAVPAGLHCMPGAAGGGGALWFSLMLMLLLAYSLPARRELQGNAIVVIPEDAFRYNTALVFLCVAGAGWRFLPWALRGPRGHC